MVPKHKGPVIIYDRGGGGVEMIFVEFFFEAHSPFSRYLSGPTRTNRKKIQGPLQKVIILCMKML